MYQLHDFVQKLLEMTCQIVLKILKWILKVCSYTYIKFIYKESLSAWISI